MSDTVEPSGAIWEKSSHSNANGGQCVEFARGFGGVVPVRDSKNPTANLVVSVPAWTAFVGQFRRAVPPRS